MKKKENLFISILLCLIITIITAAYISVLTTYYTERNSSNSKASSLINNNITDSLAIQEKFLSQAEAKGFQKGIIQHSLNTKWNEFKDKKYYSFIKTLKSGIKLYRAEMDNMMMEVYVQNGYIKIQSSSFILHDQTMQTLKEMDAWILSCNPITVDGDISNSKIYYFNDYNVTLKNESVGIHYMIANNDKSATLNNKITTNISLDKQYSNNYFSIKYPNSWQIVKDDNKVTNSTSVSVQIMEKQKNNHDFRPNINIIVSDKKRIESAITLANITISQHKQVMPAYQLLNKDVNVILSNCKGCKIEQQFSIQGYKLQNIQYTVKKKDNTTYIITATMDANKYSTQISILNQIINSLIIK